MNRQSQSGGDYSTNVQAGGQVTIVHSGLSVDAAKEIALELARPELERLTNQALEVARARAEEMVVNMLLPKLNELNPAGIETFVDPDVQFAIGDAKRTYARTGDKDVADVLVDILVDRTKELERNVRQVALSESLQVAAKLTADQFATLSLIWLIGSTRNSGVNNLATLKVYFDTYLAPHVPLIRKNLATYQHLEYAGCGSVANLAGNDFETIYRQVYGGLFSSGFTQEQMRETFPEEPSPGWLGAMLIPCLNDSNRLQINAISEEHLSELASQRGLTEAETAGVVNLFRMGQMGNPQIRDMIIATSPEVMEPLVDVWNNSAMRRMTLTTVGIVIAHANCRRILGESPAELSIWIN